MQGDRHFKSAGHLRDAMPINADKPHLWKAADLPVILFLGGCVDTRYLGHVAAEQIDWIWEHRIEDLSGIGV